MIFIFINLYSKYHLPLKNCYYYYFNSRIMIKIIIITIIDLINAYLQQKQFLCNFDYHFYDEIY